MRPSRWKPRSRLSRGHLPAGLRCWLLDNESLTDALIQRCPGTFQVRVLSQRWDWPLLDERELLGMRPRVRALVRHVHLLCGGEPWVFARTVIPPRTLRGRLRRLAFLGTRPLGAVLFADPGMARGELQVARIRPGHYLFDAATVGLDRDAHEIWGRRSVFRLSDKPLLVSEIFLPGIADCEPAAPSPFERP